MIYLATSTAFAEAVHPDDALLCKELTGRGIPVEMLVWDDPVDRVVPGDLVLIRTTWDYYRRREAFIAWCESIEARGALLLNPSSVVAWNSDKDYLHRLESAGVSIVPTTFSLYDVELTLPASTSGWVVKPTVSANAWETRRFTPDEAVACREFAMGLSARGHDVMIQPFVSSVIDFGEWSLIFIEGQYSHAVVKKPRAGDFRVQDDYGGVVRAESPSDELVAAANIALDAVPHALAYARVDLVEFDGPRVMELELIEPELFTRFADGAVPRLADMLIRKMEN